MATQKKSQQKPSSTSTKPAVTKKMTQKQYQSTHADVVKSVQGLEADLNLDLTELKKKLNCFCHVPFTPVHKG